MGLAHSIHPQRAKTPPTRAPQLTRPRSAPLAFSISYVEKFETPPMEVILDSRFIIHQINGTPIPKHQFTYDIEEGKCLLDILPSRVSQYLVRSLTVKNMHKVTFTTELPSAAFNLGYDIKFKGVSIDRYSLTIITIDHFEGPISPRVVQARKSSWRRNMQKSF
jgi:hypothetical protein